MQDSLAELVDDEQDFSERFADLDQLAERSRRLTGEVAAGRHVAIADIDQLERDWRTRLGDSPIAVMQAKICKLLRRAARRRTRASSRSIARRHACRAPRRPRARARRRRAARKLGLRSSSDSDGPRRRRRRQS